MRAIENLINGNIADAKRGAKRESVGTLQIAAMMEHGMSKRRATATALYLKGELGWQRYCDIDAEEKKKSEKSY